MCSSVCVRMCGCVVCEDVRCGGEDGAVKEVCGKLHKLAKRQELS